MDVRLVRWRYKDIRGGLRNLTIDLGETPARWTLIQMPNGTGKTTTMALLRAALSGEDLDEETVRDFRPSDDVASGEFELSISIDNRPFRILLRLNYEAGMAQYWTTRSAKVGGGLEEGHLLPQELKRLISPEFARLFIFDGELAKQIRDLSQQHAAKAVRTLYHLDRVDSLQEHIERLLKEAQERASSISTTQSNKGLKQLQSRYETATSTHTDLLRQQETYKKTLDSDTKRRGELRKLIAERLEQDQGLRKQVQEIQLQKQAAETDILGLTKEVLFALRTPALVHPRIAERLRTLGGKLDRLKLPRTMSAEFFYELAENKDCICGRPIGPNERDAIRNGAQNYLAENQIAVINSVKSAVRNQAFTSNTVPERLEILRNRLRDRQQLAQQLFNLENERVESGDTKLEEYRNEDHELAHEIEETTLALEALTTRSPERQRQLNVDWKTNIPLCKAQVEDCQARLAIATNTVRFRKQSLLANEILEQIKTSAFDRLKERVRTATNQKLATLIPSESIEVSRIEGGLVLSSTRLRSKSQVSEGQSLSVAYAFLTSLFQDAPYRLPFIVDSPAVSLDNRVRREVGELVPMLFDQMIMFIISSERVGFADAFYKRKDVRYLTIWRESENETRLSDSLEDFKNFHSDETPLQKMRRTGRVGR